jgi:hypothetical protein
MTMLTTNIAAPITERAPGSSSSSRQARPRRSMAAWKRPSGSGPPISACRCAILNAFIVDTVAGDIEELEAQLRFPPQLYDSDAPFTNQRAVDRLIETLVAGVRKLVR